MDLRFTGGEPSTAERAAVDQVLGPPTSGWSGGERTSRDGRLALMGAEARAGRHRLLPALQAVQGSVGWISPGALDYICRRLTVPPADAFGVATFYSLLSTEPRPGRMALVCDDIVCRLAAPGLGGRLGSGDDAGWEAVSCLGMCDRAPAALVQVAGGETQALGEASVEKVEAALAGRPGDVDPGPPRIGWADPPGPRLLSRVGIVDPTDFDAYVGAGGYAALAEACRMGPDAVVDAVKASGLRGRGGAAFPTGLKWEAVAAAPDGPRFVVANADESEPGTFKDRVIMEHDPFALIEAMTIAGYATGCATGYLYVRGEYPAAAARLAGAIGQCRQRSMLGPDVMGAGFGFDVEIRLGGGAYICGEETALFNSIEGFRGEPRSKPPFPTESGLFGRPTVVNNVETLVNVPGILTAGAEAFASTGTPGSGGTKLFCVSGHVRRPGVYEVPFGTPLAGLIDLAGGALGEPGAVLLGGAAGRFVAPGDFDLPLTFEDAAAARTSLGSGAVVVFDREVEFGAVVRRIAAFFRHEACGQCVPCRVGTVRQEEALARLTEGGDLETETAILADLAGAMRDASICGLGHTAADAIQSALALGLLERGTP